MDSDVIMLWTNTDLFDVLVQKLPKNRTKIISREYPKQFKTLIKQTHTPFPLVTRPVFSRASYKEFNCISTRMFSTTIHRKIQPNVIHKTNEFVEHVFRKDFYAMQKEFSANPICFDSEATLEWLSHRKDANAGYNECVKYITSDVFLKDIAEMKVHVKTESLYKPDPIMNWGDEKARNIIAMLKGATAAFSPGFMLIKQRFK